MDIHSKLAEFPRRKCTKSKPKTLIYGFGRRILYTFSKRKFSKRAGVPHTCADCCRSCGSRTQCCEMFYPANMQKFTEKAVDYLRENTEKSKNTRLKRSHVKDRSSFDDKVTTLDKYYVLLINSVLSEIRNGKTDYLFDFEQIRDILRFKRDISVKYIPEADSFEIKAGREDI